MSSKVIILVAIVTVVVLAVLFWKPSTVQKDASPIVIPRGRDGPAIVLTHLTPEPQTLQLSGDVNFSNLESREYAFGSKAPQNVTSPAIYFILTGQIWQYNSITNVWRQLVGSTIAYVDLACDAKGRLFGISSVNPLSTLRRIDTLTGNVEAATDLNGSAQLFVTPGLCGGENGLLYGIMTGINPFNTNISRLVTIDPDTALTQDIGLIGGNFINAGGDFAFYNGSIYAHGFPAITGSDMFEIPSDNPGAVVQHSSIPATTTAMFTNKGKIWACTATQMLEYDTDTQAVTGLNTVTIPPRGLIQRGAANPIEPLTGIAYFVIIDSIEAVLSTYTTNQLTVLIIEDIDCPFSIAVMQPNSSFTFDASFVITASSDVVFHYRI